MPDDLVSTGPSYRLAAVAPRVRAYHASNTSVANNTWTPLDLDSESYDNDGQHFTSSANLTGTVSKTASSATLTGSGTAFTTELSVGQVISVPGGATEKRVVTAIASNTSLTVSANFANTASGQTAARVNSTLVCRVAGVYVIGGAITWASNATGLREAAVYLNDATFIGYEIRTPISGDKTTVLVTAEYQLAAWDFVELRVRQNSGGALNAERQSDYSVIFAMHRIG